MALNTAHANGGVLIFAGEAIILYCDNVETHLEDNPTQQFKGRKKGRLYLTSHRVIFNNGSSKDMLQSFSMPFHTMKNVELEQPVFGANFIKGKVYAEPGGNWEGEAKFKLYFNHGGAIEFGQAMLQAGRLASQHRPPDYAPPPYMPPTSGFQPAAPPAYAPPPTGLGFQPNIYQAFPHQPPVGSVYTHDQPPPYPGVNSAPYAGQYPMNNGYPSAPPPPPAGAYYNPANPHTAYVPPYVPPGEQMQAPPPPYHAQYNDNEKKKL